MLGYRPPSRYGLLLRSFDFLSKKMCNNPYQCYKAAEVGQVVKLFNLQGQKKDRVGVGQVLLLFRIEKRNFWIEV